MASTATQTTSPTPSTDTTTPAGNAGTATPGATTGDAGSGDGGTQTTTTTEGGQSSATQQPEKDPQWLPERLKRAERAAQKSLLDDLGVKDVEELKTRLQKGTELERQQMSEAERLKAEAEDARKAKEKAENDLRDFREAQEAQAIETMVDSVLNANSVKSTEREIVEFLLDKHIESLADDANVTEESLKPFFDDLKKSRPHLFDAQAQVVTTGDKGKPPETPPAGNAQTDTVDFSKMTEEQVREAKSRMYGIHT